MENVLSFKSEVEIENIFCHISHIENPATESSDLISVKKGIVYYNLSFFLFNSLFLALFLRFVYIYSGRKLHNHKCQNFSIKNFHIFLIRIFRDFIHKKNSLRIEQNIQPSLGTYIFFFSLNPSRNFSTTVNPLINALFLTPPSNKRPLFKAY